MDPVVGTDEIRHPMDGVDPRITTARPGTPTFRRGIRMGMELPDYDSAREDRWPTQIDTRLLASRLAANGDLACCGVPINPSPLLMPPERIVRLRVLPRLFERTSDRSMVLQLCGSRRRQRSRSSQDGNSSFSTALP